MCALPYSHQQSYPKVFEYTSEFSEFLKKSAHTIKEPATAPSEPSRPSPIDEDEAAGGGEAKGIIPQSHEDTILISSAITPPFPVTVSSSTVLVKPFSSQSECDTTKSTIDLTSSSSSPLFPKKPILSSAFIFSPEYVDRKLDSVIDSKACDHDEEDRTTQLPFEFDDAHSDIIIFTMSSSKTTPVAASVSDDASMGLEDLNPEQETKLQESPNKNENSVLQLSESSTLVPYEEEQSEIRLSPSPLQDIELINQVPEREELEDVVLDHGRDTLVSKDEVTESPRAESTHPPPDENNESPVLSYSHPTIVTKSLETKDELQPQIQEQQSPQLYQVPEFECVQEPTPYTTYGALHANTTLNTTKTTTTNTNSQVPISFDSRLNFSSLISPSPPRTARTSTDEVSQSGTNEPHFFTSDPGLYSQFLEYAEANPLNESAASSFPAKLDFSTSRPPGIQDTSSTSQIYGETGNVATCQTSHSEVPVTHSPQYQYGKGNATNVSETGGSHAYGSNFRPLFFNSYQPSTLPNAPPRYSNLPENQSELLKHGNLHSSTRPHHQSYERSQFRPSTQGPPHFQHYQMQQMGIPGSSTIRSSSDGYFPWNTQNQLPRAQGPIHHQPPSIVPSQVGIDQNRTGCYPYSISHPNSVQMTPGGNSVGSISRKEDPVHSSSTQHGSYERTGRFPPGLPTSFPVSTSHQFNYQQQTGIPAHSSVPGHIPPLMVNGNIGSSTYHSSQPFAHQPSLSSNAQYPQVSNHYHQYRRDQSNPVSGFPSPAVTSNHSGSAFSTYYGMRPSMNRPFYSGQDNLTGSSSHSQSHLAVGGHQVVCRVSPIRSRLDVGQGESCRVNFPVPTFPKVPFLPPTFPPRMPPTSSSTDHQRLSLQTQSLEYDTYNYNYQYNSTDEDAMKRLFTQFTLQALPGLPPGAQGHHLLVKTENGQYQLIRVGPPPTSAPTTAATGTPPSSSPLTSSSIQSPPNQPVVVSTTSVIQAPISSLSTAGTATPAISSIRSSNPNSTKTTFLVVNPSATSAVAGPGGSGATNALSNVVAVPATTNSSISSTPSQSSSNTATKTTIVVVNPSQGDGAGGGVVGGSSIISTTTAASSISTASSSLPSTVPTPSTSIITTAIVTPTSTPVFMTSSSVNITNHSSNSSTPNPNVSNPRVQPVQSVPPAPASNSSSGVGMTASMSMQQQMHPVVPQPLPHPQALSSHLPSSVFTSANAANSTATATSVSQMTPDTAKQKCKNFLSFLLELSAKQSQTVARNVRNLIQGLVDGKVNAEDFSDRLQKEVNSQPQPCLVGFLKKSLPPLRQSLANKELSIDGIKPPPLSSLTTTVPIPPQSIMSPQNQLRSSLPLPPPTPVRIITPMNSIPNSFSPAAPVIPSTTPIPRSTVVAMQQRFAAPPKSSPKSSKAAAKAEKDKPEGSPAMSTPKSSGSKNKEKNDKKSFSAGGTYGGDDDINDVAAMGGVNLAEETQRILGSTEMIGTQIRSCRDEPFLQGVSLQSKIKAIAAKHGLEEPSAEVASMISHAAEERIKTMLERLAVIAEHRLDVIKLDSRYEVQQDVKAQLRFLEELEKLERKRHDEQEREMLIKAAKSRSKSEDPEQAKLKAKAKEMQRVAQEELRQREANLTALQAIGPRKKPKLDVVVGSQSTSAQSHVASLGALNATSRPQVPMRPRLKRVIMRDVMFLLENDPETRRSEYLYKLFLK